MNHLKITIVVLSLAAVGFPGRLPAQEGDVNLSLRSIRARKLAENWQGYRVVLTLADGRRVKGKFEEADFFTFTLKDDDRAVAYAIKEIEAVTLRPGVMEAVLAVLGGALGGVMGAGIVALTAPEAASAAVATAGVLGATLGLWWGYKAFFQEVEIVLDE